MRSRLVAAGDVSPGELHAAYLEAIGERDDELHAYLRVVDEPTGTGIPIALKDVISTKGVETTAGSKILEGYVPVFDATVAARCKAAGLTLLGKTNTDEFAMGSSTENSAYGPSRNPWDPARVPGGSGGGRRRPSPPGSRRGRSARTPAARSSSRPRSAATSGCGPPTAPSRATGSSRSPRASTRSGRCAQTVRDCALLYAIIAGRDPADSTTVELPEPVALPDGRAPRRACGSASRARSAGLAGIEPGVRAAFERAARRSREELGAEVGECDLPLSFEYGMPCYYLIAPAEASSNLARYDGVRYGAARDGATTYRAMSSAPGTTASGRAEAADHARDVRALRRLLRRLLRAGAAGPHADRPRASRGASSAFDVIATPTSPTVAFPLGDKAADPLAMYACDLLTIPSCLAGLPGLNDPVRALRGAAGRAAADRPAVRREHALPRRPRARARDRLRRRAGEAAP